MAISRPVLGLAFLLLLLPLPLLPCAARAVAAAPLYTIQRIDPGDPTWQVRPTSINDRGEITGSVQRPLPPGGNTESLPFFRDASGALTLLPAPGDGVALNNRGEVLATGAQGIYVWTAAGGARPIPPPPTGSWLGPRTINDAGTIAVERYVDGQGTSAVRLRADGTLDPSSPPSSSFRPGFYSDVINASGTVAGYSDDDLRRPVVWETDGALRPLSVPRGGGQALAINDAGLIAGTWGDEGISGPVIASAVWRPDGEFVAIPLASGVEVATQEPRGINNLGQVVGATNLTNHTNNAYYWSEADGLHDLQSLLDASGAGWDLRWATDINDAGQIIGVASFEGGAFEGVLLTPVPEPAAARLAAAAAVLLLAPRSRTPRPRLR